MGAAVSGSPFQSASGQASTRFGQLVIGPPGSGKTTYVAAMTELLRALGRKVAIVNLDPANENMTYTANMDISDLVKVEEVMDQMEALDVHRSLAMKSRSNAEEGGRGAGGSPPHPPGGGA